MAQRGRNILHQIGNTTLLALRNVVPENGSRTVSTEASVAMAVRLAREQGLLAGTSTGANVIAALRLAEQLGPDATLVTLMCDSGTKYLGTALFQAHTSSR